MIEERYLFTEAQRSEHIVQMCRDTQLSATARLAGTYLDMAYVNRRDGVAWVSVARLSNELGISRSTVQRALRQLKDQRHFHIIYRPDQTSLYQPIWKGDPPQKCGEGGSAGDAPPPQKCDDPRPRNDAQYSDGNSDHHSERNSEEQSGYQGGDVSPASDQAETLSPADISRARHLILMADMETRLMAETLADQFLTARRKRGHNGPIGAGFERYVRSAINRAQTSWRVGKSREQTIAEWEREMTREGEE